MCKRLQRICSFPHPSANLHHLFTQYLDLHVRQCVFSNLHLPHCMAPTLLLPDSLLSPQPPPHSHPDSPPIKLYEPIRAQQSGETMLWFQINSTHWLGSSVLFPLSCFYMERPHVRERYIEEGAHFGCILRGPRTLFIGLKTLSRRGKQRLFSAFVASTTYSYENDPLKSIK